MKTLLACLVAVLMLGGCGGGDSNDGSYELSDNVFGTFNLSSYTACPDWPATITISLTDSYIEDGQLIDTESTFIVGKLLSGTEWFRTDNFTADRYYYYIYFTPINTNLSCYATKMVAFTNIEGTCDENDAHLCSFSYR